MPKTTWNTTDFSGGINLSKDSRDIEANETPFSQNLISYDKGVLSTRGVLRPANHSVSGGVHGGYSDSYPDQGIRNLYKVFPEIGFRRFGRAKYEATGSYWKEQRGANDFLAVHGLDVGTKLCLNKSTTPDS